MTYLSHGMILTRSNTRPVPSAFRAHTGWLKGWKERAQQSNGVRVPGWGACDFLRNCQNYVVLMRIWTRTLYNLPTRSASQNTQHVRHEWCTIYLNFRVPWWMDRMEWPWQSPCHVHGKHRHLLNCTSHAQIHFQVPSDPSTRFSCSPVSLEEKYLTSSDRWLAEMDQAKPDIPHTRVQRVHYRRTQRPTRWTKFSRDTVRSRPFQFTRH